MTVARDVVLAAGVVLIWLGSIAFFRLRTPFERIHAVTFVTIAGGGPILLAAFLNDGVTSRSLKCALVWVLMLPIGAVLAHVTGRALNLREGERR